MDLGSILVRIGADTSALEKASEQAAKAVNAVEKAVASANTVTEQMTATTNKAAEQMQQLERAATGAARAVAQANRAQTAVRVRDQTISISTNQVRQQLEAVEAVRRQREALGAFEDDVYRNATTMQLWWADVTDKVRTGIDTVTAGWGKFKSGLDAASKALRKTGRDLSKYLTAPLMLLGGLAIRAALQVDDAMDFIAESTGATGAVLESLQASARNMGRTTASSLADVGAVTAELYRKFGLQGEALESLGSKALDLARLTRENASGMTQSWTQMLRNWRLGASEYESSLDKMLVVSQRTGVGILDALEAMVDLGPLLRGMDYGWEQAIALIGNFYKAGVDTGNLMFGLRNAVNEFAKLQLDPNTTLWAYIRAIEQAATESEALAIAQQIFGQRSGPLFADAIRRGAMRIDELVAQVAEANGAIERTNQATWSWSEAWQQFKNRANLALEPLGVQILEIAERNLPGLSKSIENILSIFNSWPLSTQENVIKGFGVLAGLGPALYGVAGALAVIKFLLDPIGLLITGIVAGVAALAVISSKSKASEGIQVSPEDYMADPTQAWYGKASQNTAQTWIEKADTSSIAETIRIARAAGIAIPDEISKGIAAGSPAAIKQLENLLLEEINKRMPHSDAQTGPLSHISKSGVAFVDTWAAGILSNNAAVDAVHHVFTQVARLMPHSDAQTGPLSHISKSGVAFGLTFAAGIVSETGTVVKAVDVLTGALMDRTESMNTRYGHNLRILRDSTDNLWWQTAEIPGAAMRYAADVAIDGAANAAAGAATLVETLDAWAQAYAIDAEAVANQQEETQKTLSDTLVAWAEFYALDTAAYDEWVKNKNLSEMLTELAAFYALDIAEAEEYARQKAEIQKRLISDLTAWNSFYALDMEEAAKQGVDKSLSRWERLKSGMAKIGIDIDAVNTATMTALQAQAEKGFVGLLGLFGKSADKAKAIWKQLGIDLTGNNKMTFKGMEEVIADFKKNAGQIMTTLATDITTKLITGAGDWKTIFAKALSSMLSLLLQTALQAVLAAEIVQQALKWMWSPIGRLVIVGALAALAALQAAFSKQTEATPMAEGGIVTKPTLALIGEAGPEAVIPLGRGRRGPDAGGVVVNVTVTGNNISGDREADALARKVAQSITDQLRRQGIKPAYSY